MYTWHKATPLWPLTLSILWHNCQRIPIILQSQQSPIHLSKEKPLNILWSKTSNIIVLQGGGGAGMHVQELHSTHCLNQRLPAQLFLWSWTVSWTTVLSLHLTLPGRNGLKHAWWHYLLPSLSQTLQLAYRQTKLSGLDFWSLKSGPYNIHVTTVIFCGEYFCASSMLIKTIQLYGTFWLVHLITNYSCVYSDNVKPGAVCVWYVHVCVN